MTTSPFSIVVYDSANNKLGAGPIREIETLNDTLPLDRLPTVNFKLPALAERADLIQPGVQFDIYDMFDGFLGRYIYREDNIRAGVNDLELSVTADSVLKELQWRFTGFRRNYQFEPVGDVLADLLNLAPGWGLVVDPNIGNTTVTYEGNSVWAGVDELRDRWSQHFRMSAVDPRVLEFGDFGDDSGIVFLPIREPLQDNLLNNPGVVPCRMVGRSRDTAGIVNRVIPLGAGQGETALTIHGSTAGLFTTKLGTNKDGSTYAYIEDEDSVAQYGVRERVVSFPQVRAIFSDDTSIELARNALKLIAQAYLLRNRQPRTEFRLETYYCPPELRPGDLIRLDFRAGEWGSNVPLLVDEQLWVMELQRNRSSISRSTTLTVSNDDDLRTSDMDLMQEIVKDIRSLKVGIQPGPFRYENTWTKPIEAVDSTYNPSGTDADFEINLDNDVLFLTSVILRIVTYPLTLSSNFLQPQVPTSFTNTAVVGTNHQHTVPEGSSSGYFTQYESGNYPSIATIEIDGIDFSSELGFPKNSGVNAQLNFEIDVTDIIKGLSGGFKRPVSIVLTAEPRSGDIETPGANPKTGDNASAGYVELTIKARGSSQDIISA